MTTSSHRQRTSTSRRSGVKQSLVVLVLGALMFAFGVSVSSVAHAVNPTLTITADDQTSVYGGALPALTVSYSGFVNGDDPSVLTTLPTISTTATSASNVGAYVLTASGAVDPDYDIVYVDGTLTVNPVPLTITADDQTKAYGAALPVLTASYTGFVNGDTAASLTTLPTLTTTATAASHVAGNPYSIDASAAVDPNYTISYVGGTLTVTTAPLTITADNQLKVYGAALPALTASYTGFVNGDTTASLANLPTLSTTATAASHVAGSPYSITASGAVDSDYAISYVAGSLGVTASPLTITADDKSKAVGAAVPTLTASYAGFVNGDTSASLPTPPTLATTATSSSPANTYPITASGAVDPDYVISYVAGTLTVTALPTLTITVDNKTKAYGAALPTLTASYSGFVNGDTTASLTTLPTLTTVATGASPVNNYAITGSGAVDSDYTIVYVAGSLAVNPVPLTVTASNQAKVYGAALPTLTANYSGFVNGDTATALSTQPTLTTAATAASPVNNYAIAASGAVDGNYTISYVAGSLAVNPAALTVTADNKSMTAGGAVPALTASYTGFVNGDTVASLTTAPALVTTATSASPPNTYPITAAGALGANYVISYVAGVLTVNATPPILTITAADQSKVYGSSLPTLLPTYSGFVNGDTAASLTTQPTLSTTATPASAVGTYPITPAGAVDPAYIIVYASGNLSVSPAALTVTARSQAKTYGAALPLLTLDFSGFVNGDTPAVLTTPPALATTATSASSVGMYPITAAAAASPNYSVSYVPASLTVKKATLVITVNSQTKPVGNALPALTASYSGFVNGDTAASLTAQPTLSTTATPDSPVGTYPITASGAASGNYTIVYATEADAAAATLTVYVPAAAAGASPVVADPALASTGSDVAGMSTIGLAVFGLGLVFCLVTRRSRRRTMLG